MTKWKEVYTLKIDASVDIQKPIYNVDLDDFEGDCDEYTSQYIKDKECIKAYIKDYLKNDFADVMDVTVSIIDVDGKIVKQSKF